jgi:hypothetical protein
VSSQLIWVEFVDFVATRHFTKNYLFANEEINVFAPTHTFFGVLLRVSFFGPFRIKGLAPEKKMDRI